MEKKVIVIDDTELDGEVLKNLLSKAESGVQIVVSSDVDVEELKKAVEGFDDVTIAFDTETQTSMLYELKKQPQPPPLIDINQDFVRKPMYGNKKRRRNNW